MIRKKKSHDEISAIHDHGISVGTREIFLHGNLSSPEDSGVDYAMANMFIKNLRILEAESDNPVIVHQYSVGGDWSAGMAIFDALIQSPCRTLFLCHGAAQSMGSLIPQAVHGTGLRVTYPSVTWLIHEGASGIDGTLKQVESHSSFCKKINQTSYDVYASACSSGEYFQGCDHKKISQFIKNKLKNHEDWYLDAYEAVKYGFADGVFGEEGFTSIKEMLHEVHNY